MNTIVTDVDVQCGDFMWEVRAWSVLPAAPGVSSSSATFECAGEQWRIVVYPGGHDPSSGSHVAAFLNYQGGTKCVTASCELGVFDYNSSQFRTVIDRPTYVKFGCVPAPAEDIWKDWGRKRAILKTDFQQHCCVGDRVQFRASFKVRGALSSTVWQASTWAPPPTLLRDMTAMWVNRQVTGDGMLVFGDIKIPVHKSLVSSRSKRLCASFFGQLASDGGEVKLEGVDPEVMEQLVKCMYTDTCDEGMLSSMPEALLEAGDAFGLDRIVYLCEQELVRTLTVDNAAARLQLADKHVVAAHLLEASIDFIHRRFDDVQDTSGWRQLEASPGSGRIVAQVLRETQNRLKRPRESFNELLQAPDGVKRMRVDEMRAELQRRGLESFGLREELQERLATAIRGPAITEIRD